MKKNTTPKKITPATNVSAELNLLATLVKTFEKFDEEARFRNMKYFVDRFNKYVPSQNY